MNDTYPSIAIAELMRMLVDEKGMPWDNSWELTNKAFSYTNHTVMPETLEIWSEGLFSYLLPRHFRIIREIDRKFLVEVGEKYPDSEAPLKVAIITGNGDRKDILREN